MTRQPLIPRVRRRVLVGSRGSGLALRQTEEVLEQLRALEPDVDFQVLTVKTQGDVSSEAPLASLSRAIFVQEIERALLNGELDVAVHSLKDMPTSLPDGLAIGAVCKRLDPRDVLVNRWDCPLAELPASARIGTSSPRRAAQLLSLRPDVEALPIKGNVDTRLRKARGDDYDGVIVAAAGVKRLGLAEQVAEYLSAEDFVPAPGQGALAVEVRRGDDELLDLVSRIEDSPTKRRRYRGAGLLGGPRRRLSAPRRRLCPGGWGDYGHDRLPGIARWEHGLQDQSEGKGEQPPRDRSGCLPAPDRERGRHPVQGRKGNVHRITATRCPETGNREVVAG